MFVEVENYESHLVGLFMQLWGRKEGQELEPATILNNAQNPFDNWFGDITGEVRFRYFLIEFKTTREGFVKEVEAGSAKPHRTALYAHLREDEDCRKISKYGHFAAYEGTAPRLLVFEPYAHSAAALQSASSIATAILKSTGLRHEMDYRSWSMDFASFFDELHEESLDLHNSNSPWLFSKGLGVPEADLEQYVRCMYQHLQYSETDGGSMMLCAINPSTSELKVVSATPFQMVSALKDKFAAMRRLMDAELAAEKAITIDTSQLSKCVNEWVIPAVVLLPKWAKPAECLRGILLCTSQIAPARDSCK